MGISSHLTSTGLSILLGHSGYKGLDFFLFDIILITFGLSSADRDYVLKIKSSADRGCLWTGVLVNTLCGFYF
jgi:hypothetical protein